VACPTLDLASPDQSELIQHQHSYNGDEMEQHQKGNEDESYAPILPSNISISNHVDGRYTRTLSTAITTSKAGR
jgi:hypothetical protein